MKFLTNADRDVGDWTIAYVILGMLIALPLPVGLSWMEDLVKRGQAQSVADEINRGIGRSIATVHRSGSENPVIRVVKKRADRTDAVLEARIDGESDMLASYRDAKGCTANIYGAMTTVQMIELVRRDPARTGSPYQYALTCPERNDVTAQDR